MRRGGRILQALNKGNLSRDTEDQRHADQIEPQAAQRDQSPPQAPPPRTLGGRGGRILSNLAKIQSRTPQTTAESSAPSAAAAAGDEGGRPSSRFSNSSSDNSKENPSGLVRRDSNASRSSAISQQFITVDQIDYKANLPKQPTAVGAPIKLSTNYMTFDTTEGSAIEEYHVDFNPNIESIRLRYTLLRTETARAVIGPVIHWTGTNLYLPHRLKDNVTKFEAQHPITNTPVSIKLTFIKTPPDAELMPFYNSLMHKVMNKLNYVIINRQHYSPMHKITVEQHRLEVWPGWITAIQSLDGGIKLSVDASFRVLRLETVRDIMMDIKNRNRGVNLKEAFEQELVGSIIMTRYNNRAYRIDGFDLSKKPSDSFIQTKDNTAITYVDYMRHHWNVEVRDTNQPMILHRPKPKRGQEESEVVYLIPELCVTTGLTDEMRSNFNIMKAIGEHTRLPPEIRETKLTEFLEQISTDERAKSVFADWNLRVRPNLDVVDGRRLDSEVVLFGNQRSQRVSDEADWTRPATNGPVFKTVDISNWVLMFTERDSPVAQELMESIKEVSRALGIKFCAPRIVKLPNDHPTTYVNFGKREVKQTDQMVVIMTPGKNQREDRYSACKRLYSCELPVPCQFIRCGTISNPRKIRSICQKIVIQILSKVGGQPWAMKFPMKSFMIVGIDVYHDTIDRRKSCVGVVASMNEFTSSWWSHTFFQNSLEEIGQKLNVTIISAIRKYHSINGFVPQKIIVYRDGVGDGQLDTVLQFEVVQTMNAIKFYMRDSFSGEPDPHVSYVVVQKRINAKLSLREQGRVLNPRPGSLLDHTITHPEYNDFYLVSQHVNQGTVSPTKYIVLTETGTLKLEHHQKLAYKMTHMYYNWCGTIRVPAPCQYAHKLAYLTGQNIRQQASERLEDKLYYL